MLLVGSHVEIHDSHSPCDKVVDCQTILEVFVDFFCDSNKGKIQQTFQLRTEDVVVKVEVEMVVHSEGSSRGNHIDVLVFLVVLFTHL